MPTGEVPWPGPVPDACQWNETLSSWSCSGPPPAPWPNVPREGFPQHVYGPPGTLWWMTEDTWNGVQESASEGALRWLLKKWRPLAGPQGGGGVAWEVPDPLAPPAEEVEPTVAMKWIRTQIVAALGPDEEVVHTLNWRHSTQENADVDAAGVKVVGDAVRDAWAAWFIGAHNRHQLYPQQLQYKEVRASLLVQDAPAAKPAWPLPTQVSPFVPGAVGGAASASAALPYEVAHCLQLNTNWRGTSRFRGRLYLGPLAMAWIAEAGQFNKSIADTAGSTFGAQVLAAVANATDYEAHVISQKYGTSAAITGVRTGLTPDSQRRRRRDRPENFTQAWGTPVGATA